MLCFLNVALAWNVAALEPPLCNERGENTT